MLVANVVSLILAVLALRRRDGEGRGLTVAGLVMPVLGVVGGLAVLVFGVLLVMAWGMVAAAAASL
jgi:hypothetical protein